MFHRSASRGSCPPPYLVPERAGLHAQGQGNRAIGCSRCRGRAGGECSVRRPLQTGTSRRTLILSASSSAVRYLGTYTLSLLSLPYVLREVGVSSYGLWATASSVLALAGIADLGLRTEIVRRVAEAHGRGDADAMREALRRGIAAVVVLAAAFGLVLAIGAFALVPKLLDDQAALRAEGKVLFLGATALLVLGMVVGAYSSALVALQRNDYANYGALLGGVVGVATTVASASQGWGGLSLLFGAAAQFVVATAAQVIGMRRLVGPIGWPLRAQHLAGSRHLLGVSALVIVTQVSDIVDNQLDKFYLTSILGPSASAEYQIGTSLVSQLRALALIPIVLMLVAVAELGEQPERMRRAYVALAPTGVAAGLLLMAALVAFSPPFFVLLLGPEFARTGLAAQIYAVAMAVNIIAAPWALFAVGRGMAQLAALSAAVNAVVNGTSSLVFTLLWGYTGAVLGSVVGNAVGVTVLYLLIRRRADMPWLTGVGRTLLVLIPLCAAVLLVPDGLLQDWSGLIVAAAAFVFVGAFAMYALKVVDVRALRSAYRPA